MHLETNGAEIRSMEPADYAGVRALWQVSEGMGLSDADHQDRIGSFLERNPELSLVAVAEGRIVGAVLCGHDGRRGYIHHLAVARSHRRRGLGAAMVGACLERLAGCGIQKCHAFVFRDNASGLEFWDRVAWVERHELTVVSRPTPVDT